MPTVAHVVKRVTESDNVVVGGRPASVYVTEYEYRDPVFEGPIRPPFAELSSLITGPATIR